MSMFHELMMKKKGIPSRYQVLDWIQSTGTQWINTGVGKDLTHTYRFKGKVNFQDVTNRQLFGAQGATYFGVVSGYYQITQASSGHTTLTAPLNTDIDFDVSFDLPNNKYSYTINGMTATNVGSDFPFTNVGEFHLFNLDNLSFPCKCKLYGFELYDNNRLVRNFIPVYDTLTQKYGMWESVQGKFYGNAGTGTFFGWKEEPLPSRYQKVDYIEGYGLEYIATGINSNVSLTFDITYQYTGASLKDWLNIFGTSQRATRSSIQGLFSMNDYDIYVYKGNTLIRLGLMDNNKHTVHYGNPTYYDGVYKGDVGNSYSFVGELYIFTCNQLRDGVWVADGTVPMKLWGLSIETNGILVRSYIPVFDTVNNEYGLYDEVSGTFFGNVGNGAFTGGYDNNI